MNNSIRCIIVDDEQDAIDLLQARLNILFKNIEVAACFSSWENALSAMQSEQIDLVFMDIAMPGKTGLDLLQLVPKLQAEIIFVTAYDEYAVKAFHFYTSGYILKPVDDLELSMAVEKAVARIQSKKPTVQSATNAHAKIGIPRSNAIDYINTFNIQYFEAQKGYTRVVTIDDQLLSSFSIGKFKSLLDPAKFYQIHRSYIINLDFVRQYITTGTIVMHDNKSIPVGKNLKDEFRSLFSVVTAGK